MKQILFTILFLITIPAQGQYYKSKYSKHLTSIGLYSGFESLFRITNIENHTMNGGLENNRKYKTSGGVYSLGISVSSQLTAKISLETGIGYSRKKYYTSNNETNKSYPYFYDPEHWEYHYKYVTVPLRLNFTLGREQMKFIAGFGFETWFYLKGEMKEFYKNNQKKLTSFSNEIEFDVKNFNFSPIINYGLNYQFNNELSLRVEQYVRYSLLKNTNTRNIKENLLSFGLNIGLYINF